MSDLPVSLQPELAERLGAAMDREAKIVRGLDALGPLAGKTVLLVDSDRGAVRAGIDAVAESVIAAPLTQPLRFAAGDGSVDVVVGLWSSFRGVDPDELAEVDRVLRPGGRLLVVHDYGRDDVSRILGDRPEYGKWGRRSGPFLTGGFRVRVLHCWWDFESMTAAAAFLGDAFGESGAAVAATLKRPRLSYNVAVYHRTRPAE